MRSIPLPLFLMLLRLTGRKRRFFSKQALSDAVQRDRLRNSGAPPPDFTKRYAVANSMRAGRPCYVLAPRAGSAAGAAVVLYLHGGAFCMAMSKWHWRFLAELVDATGCTVHIPLYPLAPEYSHSDAATMVHGLYADLCAEYGPQRLVLMGDSAGGNLALVLAQSLAAQGLPQPRDLVLVSPWLDLTMRLASAVAPEIDDPWLALPGMHAAADWWCGGDDPALPALSPLHGTLRGLASVTLFIGTRDLLIAECCALRRLARQQGVALRCVEAEGLPHVWPLLPLVRSVAARAEIAAIVRSAAQV